MPTPITAIAGLIFGIAVISITLYDVVIISPRLRALLESLHGKGGLSDIETLARLRTAQSDFSKRTEQRLAELERVARREVHRVGFVRYNSFSDVGSDLSFSLALLNSEGDGVVVTSIFSREESRSYGKAVRKFVPQQGASKEEQAAIATARSGNSIS